MKLRAEPELFAQVGHAFVDRLTHYLKDAQQERMPVLQWKTPAEMLSTVRTLTQAVSGTQSEAERFQQLAEAYLQGMNHLHSPRYLGHQVPPSHAMAGLFEVLGSVTNQATGIYEMGPFSSAAERVLIQELGSRLGWKEGFDGLVTHGGSAANLTAILAARTKAFPESWENGVPPNAVVLTSQDSHYSNARAVAAVGMGASHCIKVGLDSRRRMDPQALEKELDRQQGLGRQVVAVIGSACATPIGQFDPLREIGKICQSRGIWFHVDAAHGGGYLMSQRHRHLLDGVELADSVTWDAHKTMGVPALCTFLLFRRASDSFLAFKQDAPYLWEEGSPVLYDSAVRTLECTKRPLVMGLWALWSVYGPEFFESLIDDLQRRTGQWFELLKQQKDFETPYEPECNILCFRYIPEGREERTLNDLQRAIRKRLMESGQFYITQTTLDGQVYLRTVVLNPSTEKHHFEELIQAIRFSCCESVKSYGTSEEASLHFDGSAPGRS